MGEAQWKDANSREGRHAEGVAETVGCVAAASRVGDLGRAGEFPAGAEFRRARVNRPVCRVTRQP